MCKNLTRVEVAFYPEYLNHWLRFGDPIYDFDLDRRRSLAIFRPGQVFGYIRWRANEYGTQEWRFVVVRTAGPQQQISRITGIHPGGEMLLNASGNTKVKRVLSQINLLEIDGFEPSEISPAFYRHMHNRTLIGLPVRGCSSAHHDAYLAARKVLL